MKKLEYYFKKIGLSSLRLLRGLGEKIESRSGVLSKLPGSRRVQPLVSRYKLVFGIGGAIAICLLLTVFSVALYVVTGTSKLDLSRPGYEDVRQKISRTPNEDSFEPNGLLDGRIIDSYLEKYKKKSQTLSKYDSFNPRVLDDAPLGLTSTQLGPSDGAVSP